MPSSLRIIETLIAQQRRDLDDWLDIAYVGRENLRYNGEVDAGYSNSVIIESLAGLVFNEGLVRRLSVPALNSLLFFISRTEECGSVIPWLGAESGDPFSHCGDLSYSDFLFLSEQASMREDDFCDYQLAACFKKCNSLDQDAIKILLRFFDKNDSYTRRTVLHTFEHFRLPRTVELAATLWQSDDCEFAKLSCLHALKKFPAAVELFRKYLQEYQNTYDINAADYRPSHIQQLTNG